MVINMNKKPPKVNILRSTNDDFIGAYPTEVPCEFPPKHPAEDLFLRGSVASASDCTGIAVVQPEEYDAARSLADLCDFPITAADGTVAGNDTEETH